MLLRDVAHVFACCVGANAATINKLLAEVIPSDLKLSAEVRDIFTDCCTGARTRGCVRLRRES